MGLEGSLRKALLKRWLLIDRTGVSSEDGQDEASQKLEASTGCFPLEENGVSCMFN